MTQNGSYLLYIEMKGFDNSKLYARYDNFRLGDEASGYTINVGTFSGTAGMVDNDVILRVFLIDAIKVIIR